MLSYRRYDNDYIDKMLTADEFNDLKLYIETNPNTYPFPSSSFSQYRNELWSELKDIVSREIASDLIFSLGGLVIVVALYFAVYFILMAAGYSDLDFSWFFGLIAVVLFIKFALLSLGVLISLANFTYYFDTRKRYYKQFYELIRSCPDYVSYRDWYRQRWAPAPDKMIT